MLIDYIERMNGLLDEAFLECERREIDYIGQNVLEILEQRGIDDDHLLDNIERELSGELDEDEIRLT